MLVNTQSQATNRLYTIKKKNKMLVMVQEIEFHTATKHIMKIILNNTILLHCFGASADWKEGTAACLPQAGVL